MMENFELIEKYAAGQLQGPDKEAFEKLVQADPSLQSDVALQKHIIDGIKTARIAELKTMLNQVPVTGAMTSGVSAVKIVSGVVTVGAIITASVFYFKPWKKESTAPFVTKELPSSEKIESKNITPVESNGGKSSSHLIETNKLSTKSITPDSKKARNTNSTKPKIEVVDPTDELTQEVSAEKGKTDRPHSAVVASRIAVETNTGNKDYSFHYQFSQGKLILYGNFDKGLYEILEVNGDQHSVFLFYKDLYYLLNERQANITPLTPIKDQQLIQKLKEYRGR